MQSVYDSFPAYLYTAYQWYAICNCFLQMAAYSNNDCRREIVAHPGSAAGLSNTMLRGAIWNMVHLI